MFIIIINSLLIYVHRLSYKRNVKLNSLCCHSFTSFCFRIKITFSAKKYASWKIACAHTMTDFYVCYGGGIIKWKRLSFFCEFESHEINFHRRKIKHRWVSFQIVIIHNFKRLASCKTSTNYLFYVFCTHFSFKTACHDFSLLNCALIDR